MSGDLAPKKRGFPDLRGDNLGRRMQGSAASSGAFASEDEAAIRVLRTSGSIAIFFLVTYLINDLDGDLSSSSILAFYHWVTISAALLFFGVTWTSVFRRHWRFCVLGFSIALLAIFILISAQTRDPDSRYVAILLFPIATASFVDWGWRWQCVMSAVCIALYALARRVVPLVADDSVPRWLGLFAAVTLAQATALFMQNYRERIRVQLRQLIDAAALRESQVATMAHDIRSPLAAISGFVELLQDDELDPEEREALLSRIGSTAWNMDLTVANVLDLYQIQEGHLPAARARIDPNQAIADAVEHCEAQAARKGLRLTAECASLPEIEADPRHLERVARNLLAYEIGRLGEGEIRLRAFSRDDSIVIEVSDDGPSLSAEQLGTLFLRPGQGRGPRSSIGLYITRVIVESAGGRVEAKPFADSHGLALSVRIPTSAQGQALDS